MDTKERLKHLRMKLLGLTQPDFAAKIGLKSTSIVQMMEAGTRQITDRTIKSIHDEFHVSEVWLRTGEGNVFLPSVVADPENEYDPHGGFKGHSFSELTGLEGDAYRRAFRMLLEIFEAEGGAKYQRAIMSNLEAFSESIKADDRIGHLEKQVAELTAIVQQQTRASTDRRQTPGVGPEGIERRSGEDRRKPQRINNGNHL